MEKRTYGKINPLKKILLDFQSAFKINPKSREFYQTRGMDVYRPKLKKRFYFALVLSFILVSPIVPGGVFAVPFIMMWGTK